MRFIYRRSGLSLAEIAMSLVVAAIVTAGTAAAFSMINESRKVNSLVEMVIKAVEITEGLRDRGAATIRSTIYTPYLPSNWKMTNDAIVHTFGGRFAISDGAASGAPVPGSYVMRLYNVPPSACRAVRDLPLRLRMDVVYTTKSGTNSGWGPVDGNECGSNTTGIGYIIY